MSNLDAVQASFYTLHFKNAFHEKKGTAFQDWFVLLAGHVFGPDFEEVRPYGPKGDLKCDGRRISTGTIFQSYAPYLLKESDLAAKIKEDFSGAVKHWGKGMRVWTLVHNDARGLPPAGTVLLDQFRKDYPDVILEVWSEPELLALHNQTPLESLIHLYGYAPSLALVERLALGDLIPIIEGLALAVPNAVDPPLQPPSLDKLEKNKLSDEAALLLQIGRRKSDLVRTFFKKGARVDLGERIAQAFREHYAMLKALGLPSDRIFAHFQDYAGAKGGDPQVQGAALAVLTYFFDSCDIFEDPDTNGHHDLAN